MADGRIDDGPMCQSPQDDEYAEALSFYNEPRWQNVSLGLDRMRLLLDYLDHPEKRFACVHVAGTNGKGSVCAYLDSILREAGLKCGLFTSPYIERFEERIRVDGLDISPGDLIAITPVIRKCAARVAEVLGEHPTEFELMCAVAFLHFANKGCDICVCEVGLGGRLDATNVIDPILCVITRIGLDHTDLLGNTYSAIAHEKAGIVKQGIPIISWPQEKDAMQVIDDVCASLESRLIVPDFGSLEISLAQPGMDLRHFTYNGHSYESRMIADYQIRDATLAIEAANLLSSSRFPQIGLDHIACGIRNASWPGRFEILGRDPLMLVDGAHNPQGAQGLFESLRALGLYGDSTLVCGMLSDKECAETLRQMIPLANRLITYTPKNQRAMPSEDLAGIARDIAEENGLRVSIESTANANDAVNRAFFEIGRKKGPDAIIAFGTLYSISEIKSAYFDLFE